MKNDPIEDYILKNKRNLCVAAAVSKAWPDAREKLVSDFLGRLDARLMKRFRGWKSGRWGVFLVDQWPDYYFWKPAWREQYSICLQCNNYGERMSFGVALSEARSRKRPPSQELLDAVTKLHPSARAEAWWEAKIAMRSPAEDWRKPEVLWRMHTDGGFLEEVAEQLVEIAEKTAVIIDRLVRRK